MLDELIKFAQELYKKDKEMGLKLGNLVHKLGGDLANMIAYIDQLEKKKGKKK
jgi:hypothetical protein